MVIFRKFLQQHPARLINPQHLCQHTPPSLLANLGSSATSPDIFALTPGSTVTTPVALAILPLCNIPRLIGNPRLICDNPRLINKPWLLRNNTRLLGNNTRLFQNNPRLISNPVPTSATSPVTLLTPSNPTPLHHNISRLISNPWFLRNNRPQAPHKSF